MSVRSKRSSAALAAMVWVAAASAALAQERCAPVLTEQRLNPVLDYDAFEVRIATDVAELTLENTADAPCDLVLVVEDVGGLPPPFVLAGLSVGVGLADAVPSTDRSVEGTYRFQLPASSERRLRLDFAAPLADVVPAGRYGADFRLTILDEDGAALIGPLQGQLAVAAAPRAQVNIAGARAAFGGGGYADVVEFDDPAGGDRARVFIQLRSNAPTSMTIASANGGRLVNVAREDSWIAWHAEVDGAAIDLAAPIQLEGYGATDLAGRSVPFDVVVGEAQRRFAGRYEDVVTVTVTAQ